MEFILKDIYIRKPDIVGFSCYIWNISYVEELIRAHEAGFEAGILFVIQMKGARRVEPNWRTHEAFGEALQKAQAAGVKVLAYDCRVEPDLLELDEPVEVAVE